MWLIKLNGFGHICQERKNENGKSVYKANIKTRIFLWRALYSGKRKSEEIVF